MKHIVFIVLALAVGVEDALSQPAILDRRVKIEIVDGTIGSVLNELGEKGGFIFSYGQDIPHNERVVLNRTNQTVQQYLDEIFHGNVHAVEFGNKLAIRLKPKLPEVYSIRGTVIDSGTKEPIAGVTVYLPGTEPLIGCTSDDSGNFRINVPFGMEKVRFSSIGYESLELNPDRSASTSIELKPRDIEIDELTIVYPENPLDRAANVSVSYVPAHILERIPVTTIDHVLQGAASGVDVTRTSGMPGASLQVNIRGKHSLINSDPAYYLDGIPIQQAALHALSPNDIESVEVLKDASSCAEYGASAGNGVILLNTRKGLADKSGASLTYYFGQQHVVKTLDLLSTGDFLDYYYLVRPTDRRFDKYDSLYRTTDTDWINELFHPATTEDLHFAVSGGNKKSVVYTSTGYFHQSAIIKEMEFKRYSFRINSDHLIHPKLQVGQDLVLSHVKYDGLKEGSFMNDYGNPILSCMCMLPYYESSDSSRIFMGSQVSLSSPYDDAELTRNSRKNYAVLGNVHTSYAIMPQLSFETRLGVEVYYQDNVSYCKSIPTGQVNPVNPIIGNEYSILDLAFDWQNRLIYDAAYAGGHSLKAMAGFEYGQSNNRWIPMYQSYYDKNMNLLTTGPVPLSSSGVLSAEKDFINHGVSGSLNYSYRDKYFIDLQLRNDRVEYYLDHEPRKLSGWYPSFGLGWVFSKENFISAGKFMDYGKVRYGWGRAGNSPRMNYSFYAKMMRDMDFVYAFNSAGDITFSAQKRQTSEKFYWESSSAHDVGIDLGFMHNKLFISFDYFSNFLNKAEKYTVDKPIDFIGGLYSKDSYGIDYLPSAKITNRGVESNLNYRQTGRRLKWEFNLHFTHFRNRIVDIEENAISFVNDPDVDPISVNRPGYPAGSFYGYKIEKLFSEEDIQEGLQVQHGQPTAKAGDYQFADLDHNGTIDRNDRTVLGNPSPDFSFGLYSNVQFHNFDLSLLIQGIYGNEIFNATKLWLYNPYGRSNWSSDIKQSYRSPTYENGIMTDPGLTNTTLHRFDYYATNKNLRVSDFYIEDGSYLRVKNIQLGYTLDPGPTRRIHMENFRVFICAQNLWTFTSYSGLDPEVGGWGIDCGNYPQPRTYMAGVQMDF
jgi:TonB-linked SusC/RagA family outer membrane protein